MIRKNKTIIVGFTNLKYKFNDILLKNLLQEISKLRKSFLNKGKYLELSISPLGSNNNYSNLHNSPSNDAILYLPNSFYIEKYIRTNIKGNYFLGFRVSKDSMLDYRKSLKGLTKLEFEIFLNSMAKFKNRRFNSSEHLFSYYDFKLQGFSFKKDLIGKEKLCSTLRIFLSFDFFKDFQKLNKFFYGNGKPFFKNTSLI